MQRRRFLPAAEQRHASIRQLEPHIAAGLALREQFLAIAIPARARNPHQVQAGAQAQPVRQSAEQGHIGQRIRVKAFPHGFFDRVGEMLLVRLAQRIPGAGIEFLPGELQGAARRRWGDRGGAQRLRVELLHRPEEGRRLQLHGRRAFPGDFNRALEQQIPGRASERALMNQRLPRCQRHDL